MTSLQNLKKALAKDVKKAARKVYANLEEEVDRVIESDSEFSDLGFKKNIVLSGRLRDSRISDIQEKGESITYESTWDPANPDNGYHYATAVHEGFFAWGHTYIPGRPWTERTIENIPPESELVKELKKLGYDAKVTKKSN